MKSPNGDGNKNLDVVDDTSSLTTLSLLEVFRIEVETQAQALSESLLELESIITTTSFHENKDSSLKSERHSLNSIFAVLTILMRAAHSIKGAARIVKLESVVRFTHCMEDCFTAAQTNLFLLSEQLIDELLQGVDWLYSLSQYPESELLEWLTTQSSVLEQQSQKIIAALETGNRPKQTSPLSPADPIQASGSESLLSLDVTDVTTASSQPLVSPPSSPSSTDRRIQISTSNLSQLMALAGESVVEANWLQPFAESILQLKQQQQTLSQTLDRLNEQLGDKLPHPLIPETLKDAQNQLQTCKSITDSRLQELDQFSRRFVQLSDNLYREVLACHMCPFGNGVQGLSRLVRDLSKQLKKQLDFEIVGTSTRVDRDILQKLETPLIHLLQNAICHGIEMPEERQALGKMHKGKIRLEATHRSGMLSITVSDDGKGIEPEDLRQKILKQQLTTPEIVAQLTDAELMEFLFLPGFSTAGQLTDVEGRGFGLDIAKNMAQEVGGLLRAFSRPGQGMTFQFQLPLTLSVVRALLVEIGGEPYAFALMRIDRVLNLNRQEIYVSENRQYSAIDGQNIGLVAADQVLGVPSNRDDASTTLAVIVMSDLSHQYGVIVDRFLGEQDLVVRPLDERLGKVPNISAAALMEDGTPVLIVDVADWVRSIDQLVSGNQLESVSTEAPRQISAQKRILVVDDSITVRAMERKLLENQGYRVDMAVDGMEGWNLVRMNDYDLVISDIDMPRMDGVELVTQIKNHSKLQDLPVIILSYKDRYEDKVAGLNAGADYYLTKSSFHDDALINAVADLIG